MAVYTYRISASGTATGADAGFTNFFNAIADFRTNNRMGAGVGVVPANSTLFFKFDGMTGQADAEIYDINLSASGSKIVLDAWSNPWNASSATALGDTSAFDGLVMTDVTVGVFQAQGGNIEARNLVMRKTAGLAAVFKAYQYAGTGTILFEKNLVVNTVAVSPYGVALSGGTTMRNCTVLFTNASQSGTVFAVSCGEGVPTIEHSTFISYGGIGTLANAAGTVPVVKNSYVGGFSSTPWAGITWAGTSVGNASSGTGTPNSGLTSVALSTTNFESVTGSGDFRVKAGSVLKTTGATRLASTLTDAYGTSRDTTATIGAMEYAASAPVLSAPTAVATGPTQATVACNTDTPSTGTMYFLRRTGTTPADAATVIATGESQAAGANPQQRAMTTFTTNVPYYVDMAQTGSTTVASVGPFTPSTLAYSGTVAAQTATINAAFTFSGVNISTLFSGGIGTKSYTLASGTLPAGMTINSSTGNPQGTPTESGVFTVAVRGTDQSTVPSAQTADTNSFTITVSPAAALASTLDAIASDFQFIQQNALAISLTLDPVTSGLAFSIQPGVLDIEPLANGSTSVWAGRNDVSLRVYHDTTGTLLYMADPVSTDGVGQLAQVSSTAIQAGQWVIVVVRIPTSPVALGVWRYQVG